MVTAETVGGHIQEERDTLRSGARQLKDKIENAGESIQEQSQEAWDEVMESIRKHPGRALGITLATGVVVGLSAAALTRRQRSAFDGVKDIASNGAEAIGRVRSGLQDAIETLKDAIDEAVTKFK